MTQEQKAKAYDEAFERAKKQLEEAKVFDYKEGQIAHDIRTITYAIFPELKEESDDERIRKALIDGVRQIRCKNGITQEQMLAWLEKQKESGIKWFKSDNLKNPDKPYIDKVGMFYTTDGRMCYVSEIEKQKKQKPVDLVEEEYIENRNDGTFTFNNTEKEATHNELTIEDIKELDRIYWEIESEMGFEESDAFYKEVLKRFKKYKYGNAKEDTDINGTEG